MLPVPLSESLEMSRLLEALASELAPEERLARLERDHADALKVLREPPADGRLAGLVVAYTAPEREELPAPVVGEPEERLSRIGELEREIEELRERADAALALAEQALALVGSKAAPSRTPVAPADGDSRRPPSASTAGSSRSTPPSSHWWATAEADFRHARWPSLADRDRVAEHRALLARLATGEIERARVETVYMHGQGLTVPVKGTLELVRADDGSPRHLLLSVDHSGDVSESVDLAPLGEMLEGA